MIENTIKKMEEMLTNEDFFNAVQEAGSPEAAYAKFAENGLDASYDDFLNVIAEFQGDLKNAGLIGEEGEVGVELLEIVSGGAHCRVCNSHVKDGFWNMYKHCFKHSWNAVMPLVTLYAMCYGIVI